MNAAALSEMPTDEEIDAAASGVLIGFFEAFKDPEEARRVVAKGVLLGQRRWLRGMELDALVLYPAQQMGEGE